MKESNSLGRIYGIDIRVHVTFWLLVPYVAFREYRQQGTVIGAIAGAAFMLLVFVTVVLHELGHAAVARKFGIGTKRIVLYPTGGVAELERMPHEPRQELLVAVAGPAVNVALAAISVGVLLLLREQVTVDGAFNGGGSIVARFAAVNAAMAVFNLLPALPMDGGRVLRAILAIRLGYEDATRRAGIVGKAMAVLLALVGFAASPMLVVVAVFVWMGADAEIAESHMRVALTGLTVRSAMLSEVHTVHPDDSLGYVATLLVETPQADFPVLREGLVVGLLTHDDLVGGLARADGGREARVSSAMRTVAHTLDPSEPLLAALAALHTTESTALPVVAEDHLVGLLSLAHVGELLLVRSALDAHEAQIADARRSKPRGNLRRAAGHVRHA